MASEYDYIKGSFYVVLEPDIRGAYVYSIKGKKLTQSKPALARGQVAVKLNLKFLKASLLESIPQFDLEVTNFAVGKEEPVAEVLDANE